MTRDLDSLGDEIAALASHIAAATARWLGLVAEFDERLGWNEGGFKNCAHWLSWRCGIAPGTARDHVRVANGLRARPAIAAAFERGELSYSKVRALVRVHEDVDEDLLLGYAQGASAGQLERIVRGYRRVERVAADAAVAYAERELSWFWDEDGSLVFSGRLPAELGAVVVRAIEAARDELGPPPPEPGDCVSAETEELTASPRARNADALVAIAQSGLAERASSADVYQVVVHVDAEALAAGSKDSAELDGAEPLPAAAARRLACDASLVRVLERDGATISLGRKTRAIPPALRRALRLRYDGCAFPGCGQRHHTDGHHIRHWADGGETTLDNLVQLCRHHHRLLHEGRFELERRAGGLVFKSPDGRPIPQAPRQPRGDGAAIARPARPHRRTRPVDWALHPVASAGQGFELGWAVEALADSRAARRE